MNEVVQVGPLMAELGLFYAFLEEEEDHYIAMEVEAGVFELSVKSSSFEASLEDTNNSSFADSYIEEEMEMVNGSIEQELEVPVAPFAAL